MSLFTVGSGYELIELFQDGLAWVCVIAIIAAAAEGYMNPSAGKRKGVSALVFLVVGLLSPLIVFKITNTLQPLTRSEFERREYSSSFTSNAITNRSQIDPETMKTIINQVLARNYDKDLSKAELNKLINEAIDRYIRNSRSLQ